MAHWSHEAWVTSAVSNEAVANVLVLAASIQDTATTRKKVVIASKNVSVKNRHALGKAFDMVFFLEEIDISGKTILNEALALAYTFALIPFHKCVYVSPNSMFLQNADNLFEGPYDFQSKINQDESFNLSTFMLIPNKDVWMHIRENMIMNLQDLSEQHFNMWLKNQNAKLNIGMLQDGIIADFSISNRKLLSHHVCPQVIHFSGNTKESMPLYDQLKLMNAVDIGLHEKLIVKMWLELYDKVLQSYEGNTSVQLPLQAFGITSRNLTKEPIAIVGMSCRYPAANNLEEFWNLLYKGEEGICLPPKIRWSKPSKEQTSQAGFLSVPLDKFDAGFFGVSPKDAVYMDPQARLLHEVMWEALEDAGIDPLGLYGSHTGIFTGSWTNEYRDFVQDSVEKDFFRTYLGNSMGAVAARLSFVLGLTGPSIATESGCSSAIVALDLAVKSLRAGETNLALAGGVNLLLQPIESSMMEVVISPDGRCKTFDAKADGFGRAEGCGVLVLKRLSDALRDRDHIWAMVRGSAISQEGMSRSLGTPTEHCEALAMQLALKDANVLPEQVSFVEAHGTGTKVGDPMEISAISRAYYSPERKTPLIIGSVKTNVGHTESCSGITGVMKAVLALQHELIPKHRNLDTINPEIVLDSIPAIIPMENMHWPKIPGQTRICGVSSFGLTGTDGHVIIEEAPNIEPPKFNLGFERPTHLMTISGKTSEALDGLLCEYENRFSELAAKEDKSFANLVYSANVGRASFNHRAFLVANDYQDGLKVLQTKRFLRSETKDGVKSKLCFLFTGQGSQYQGMAKLLYKTSPIFRVNFDVCSRTMKEMYNLCIDHVLWDLDSSSKELGRTLYSQTSIFCVEYCLLKLWESWGIKPDYVLGHSLGEFCAAVAVGVLDLEDALKLVAERSRLIDSLPRGNMLVIRASKPEVETLMKAAKIDLDFAAVNSPDQTVVAGDTKQVAAFLAFLNDQNIKAIILEATHAFHSRHMDPILETYSNVAQSIRYKPKNPNVQYISGMEGRIIVDISELGAEYWVRHTRDKVSFVEACSVLRKSGCKNFLEVGPQPILSSFLMQNLEGTPLSCLASLRKNTDDWETILTSLGKLYLLGYQVDWKSFDDLYCRKRVSLPFHPFHRKDYWVERNSNETSIMHPLVGFHINNASSLSIFQNDLKLSLVPYLKDHHIGNRALLAGACFTEMCLFAGYSVSHNLTEICDIGHAVSLENLEIHAPLELSDEKKCRLQTVVDLPERPVKSSEKTGYRIRIYHKSPSDSGKWLLNASSTFIPVASLKTTLATWNVNRIPEIISSSQVTSPDKAYKSWNEQGMRFGDTFRMIRKWWHVRQHDLKRPGDEVVAEMELPGDLNKYIIHPLILDAALQTCALTRFNHEEVKLKVPVRIKEITFISSLSTQTLNNVSSLYLQAWNDDAEKSYIFVATSNWTPVAFISDVELVETNTRTIESILEQQFSSIPDAWEETWKVIPSPFDNTLKHCVGNVDLPDGSVTSPKVMEIFTQTNKLIYLYILKALLQLGWKPILHQKFSLSKLCSHLQICTKYYQLLRFYMKVLQEEGILDRTDAKSDIWIVIRPPPTIEHVNLEINQLNATFKSSNASNVWAIYEHISIRLMKILRGKESALAILYPQDELEHQFSADSFYQNHPSRRETKAAIEGTFPLLLKKSFIENQHSQGKVFRFLEVGAGTGSGSLHALQWLQQCWADKFEVYYTDVSSTFFIKAAKKLEEFTNNITFKVFNIEQSPLSQGIPLGYFDMVCATDVLHATRNLEESLVHLRQTLKPGGLIYFSESVIPSRDITYVFGLLEGYWRYEDQHWREEHCCVGVDIWKQVLEKSGFEQVQCTKTYMDQFALILARADKKCQVERLKAERFVVEPDLQKWIVFGDNQNLELISNVANMLDSSGFDVEIIWRENKMPSNDDAKRCLTERINSRVLKINVNKEMETLFGDCQIHGIVYFWGMDADTIDQEEVALPFLSLAKSIVQMLKPPRLLVVTTSVHAINEDTDFVNPNAATLWGMVKSLKNETDMTIRVLDLDANLKIWLLAEQLLYELAMLKGPHEQHRLQVAYRGNVRYEPRLCKANLPTYSDLLKLPPSTDRYHLKLPKTRMIQDLDFEPLDYESICNDEIEIRVCAYALNFKDILSILKPTVEFESLNAIGFDVAGIVTKRGPESKWKLGDEVFGVNLKGGQMCSYLTLNSESVLQIPDTMTFEEAVTLPTVFLTAYHCLINVAKMKKGDKVLIHTGSGGVGLAAIQIAKAAGAEIITTAGNPRKRAYLKSLGIQHVFHSRDTSFEQDILRVTNAHGVDIVLNSITGPGIKEATLRATAKNGRFVEMSKMSIWKPEDVQKVRPDVSYNIVDLTVLDMQTSYKICRQMSSYLSNNQLKGLPYTRFDALCIRQALQYFQKAKHIGKVVITMPEVGTHQGEYKTDVRLFNNKSTYLITGGLGGIGFEVCQWMLKQGAKNIVLTGRSPPSREIAEQIRKLNSNLVNNVTVKLGDIGNYENCKSIIADINANMKPLRGIMHCAGVLKDGMFTNQNWNNFKATYNPKITGTWNLHMLTKNCSLEHFVVYSSMAALVGTPYQPNHCSANCFEDAFIHYRHSLGLPGTSINWGQWAQVGCAKDISLSGLVPISVQRMLNGMEMALRAQKRQVCFSELDSFDNFAMLCPSFKNYLEERLWKQQSGTRPSAQGTVKSDQFWREMDDAHTKQEKSLVISLHVAAILKQSLRLEDEITITANLQELGVDSLMMIELKNSIQSLLGNRLMVTTSMVKNCDTIQSLATAVVCALTEQNGQTDNMLPKVQLTNTEILTLLTGELELEDDINVSLNTKAPVKASQIRNVLVTGATGKVAPYLIATLSSMHIDKIWCLITEGNDMTKRLTNKLELLELTSKIDLRKIECVAGNVAQGNFGLSKETYEKLCKSVDAVIHCAAKTHPTEFINLSSENFGEDMRSVNIGGTKNVLRFASKAKVKHVFYPSTLTLEMFSKHEEPQLEDFWPEHQVIEALVERKLGAFQATKAICELLLKQANQRGIPCKVFRFPWICSKASSGRSENTLNSLNILRFILFLKVGAIPNINIAANVLPVDICADVSIPIFLNEQAQNHIYNLGHIQPQPEKEFVNLAKEEFGKTLKILERSEFESKMKEEAKRNKNSLKHLLLNQKIDFEDVVNFLMGSTLCQEKYFQERKINKPFEYYGKDFPSAMEVIRRDLTYMKEAGLMETLGI